MSTSMYGAEEQDAPMYCANHPKEQTYLRCGRCDKPICAKCRVSTPAGFRCFDCANLQVLPTYAISADYYAKAAIAGLLVAFGGGVLMGLFPAFEFWAALLLGIAVPEAIAVAANQKRGQGLQALAMGAVVFGFLLSRLVMSVFPDLIPLGGINAPARSILPFHITQFTIIWLALALFLANRRLR